MSPQMDAIPTVKANWLPITEFEQRPLRFWFRPANPDMNEGTKGRCAAPARENGGEAGIRTLGGHKPSLDFESSPFGHSGTSPGTRFRQHARWYEQQ